MTLTFDKYLQDATTTEVQGRRSPRGSSSQVEGEGVGWKVYRGGCDYNEAVCLSSSQNLCSQQGVVESGEGRGTLLLARAEAITRTLYQTVVRE